MQRVVRLVKVRTDGVLGLEPVDGFDHADMVRNLAGYVLERSAGLLPPGVVTVRGCVVVVAGPFGGPDVGMGVSMQPSYNGADPKPLQLRPIGRLVPVAAPQAEMQPTVRSLRPVQSGESYRITSPPARGLVRPELAEALESVFERFAREHGFTSEKPLEIRLSRGFKAGSHGHGQGRGADISVVDGKGLLEWKQEWDRAMAAAEKLSEPQQQAEAIAVEQKRNLGYGLYKALQEHGGWRVDPKGWRVYQGVMQLFGPWTASEGPWKAMQIKAPNPYQRQRLADQQWVFRAHRDHIHVAR